MDLISAVMAGRSRRIRASKWHKVKDRPEMRGVVLVQFLTNHTLP